MSPIGVIKSYPKNPRTMKALIAAEYTGVDVQAEDFDVFTQRDEAFYDKFPLGKVPVFESEDANLFESSAIAYYVALQKANNSLLGKTNVEKAKVLQWILFTENELYTHIAQWLYVFMGYVPYIKPNVDGAIEKLKRSLGALNKTLETRTYLVGESITLADISVVCALDLCFRLLFDKPFRDQYKNLTRYYTTVAALPVFIKYLGEISLCKEPLKYTPPKKEAKKKEVKKEEKKEVKKEVKKEEKKEAEEEEGEKPAPKVKSKLDLLPKSSFILDAWKREYSNNDTKDAIKWFWEHFDPEGYSIWKVDYKYNNELTQTFMSNNLIGGFYARLERAHKYAFGSMIVRGKDNDNTISGYFVVRGQEVPFEIYDAADYESFNFQKIEPADYESKKEEIYKYFAWEFDDCVDGKVFK